MNMGEIAIMALPLTLIVITGEIDLSVASMLGLSGTVVGYLFAARLADLAGHAVPPSWSAPSAARSTACWSPRLGLPSIAVTIGTLTLFRGLAEIIAAVPDSVTEFPTCADQDRRRSDPAHPDRLLRR